MKLKIYENNICEIIDQIEIDFETKSILKNYWLEKFKILENWGIKIISRQEMNIAKNNYTNDGCKIEICQ